MGVKKLVTDRLDKARSFAEDVRAIYEDAYNKAIGVTKGGLEGVVKEIEPKLRGVFNEGLQGAQTALDNINQSLADKAIPAFRKRAVSQEKLDHKAKGVVKETAAKAVPVKRKRAVKKVAVTKKATLVTKRATVNKKSTSTPARKRPSTKE